MAQSKTITELGFLLQMKKMFIKASKSTTKTENLVCTRMWPTFIRKFKNKKYWLFEKHNHSGSNVLCYPIHKITLPTPTAKHKMTTAKRWTDLQERGTNINKICCLARIQWSNGPCSRASECWLDGCGLESSYFKLLAKVEKQKFNIKQWQYCTDSVKSLFTPFHILDSSDCLAMLSFAKKDLHSNLYFNLVTCHELPH